MNDHEIRRYVGVGDLKFGMSPEDVQGALGSAESGLDDEESGTVIEFRHGNAMQTAYDRRTMRLVLISMYAPTGRVRVGDRILDWSDSEPWYNSLRDTDPSARQVFGVSVFFKYGISTTGMSKAEKGDKSVTAFAQGQWDENDRAMRPLGVRRTSD
jgi:hypothetical protein